jgi:hypothetical protein
MATVAEDGLDRLSRRIGLVGGIIAALVGINTVLTTCSNDAAARYAGFRQAVAAEEGFWKTLYGDYLGAFGRNVEVEEKRARLFAIWTLSDRDIPPFAEHRLGFLRDDSQTKQAARTRLVNMKRRLREAISQQRSSDVFVVQGLALEQFEQAEATKFSDTATEVVRLPVPASGSAAVNLDTQVLSMGLASGWDIDVFWCAGGGAQTEAANYSVALDRARSLAAAATAQTQIAPGVRLGRVRVRVLPEARQGLIPGTRVINAALGDGHQMRAEASEAAAAERIAAFLNRKQPPFQPFQSQTRTPWYLSLFACAAPISVRSAMADTNTTGPAVPTR